MTNRWERHRAVIQRAQDAGFGVSVASCGARSVQTAELGRLQRLAGYKTGPNKVSFFDFDPWFAHKPSEEALKATFSGHPRSRAAGVRLFGRDFGAGEAGEVEKS